MELLVVIMFGIIGWYLAISLVFKYIRRGMDKMDVVSKKNCPPHNWEEIETFPNSGFIFLKCKDCKKSLDQVMNG